MIMAVDRSKTDDMEVIGRVLDGDSDSFGILLDRYTDHVMKIVGRRIPRDDVEETAHEVFIRAFRSLGRFAGKSPFPHWLASIAVRTCHDYWRERYRGREMPVSDLSVDHQQWLEKTISEEANAFHESTESREAAREVLDRILARLSPDERTIVQLIHLDGYSVAEASELTGWSAANVKIRAFRARNRMRKL
ncbi:MAG TPA: RNA polymerase sigma factor, partial [Candidatus Krumholzibacterium sp.]|nr:RNA polymerase sigma factor [Candidatus Krumholzibacterium sp.]